MRTANTRRRARLAAAGAMLLVWGLAPTEARAQGQALTAKLSGRGLMDALAMGGHVILLRHTATDPFVPDPVVFDIEDCSSQRNLSEQGRHQARQIGRAIEKLGIVVGQVLSSPYCRCLETGKLAFDKVEKSEALSVTDQLPPDEKDARGAKIRQLLGTEPAPGSNTVLITHTGNLLYAFGLQSRPEGIAHVFRPSVVGPAIYVGRVTPEEWAQLAELEAPTP
ncbi:MAG: histidine phosphatase family protein [Myxococcota bacterium]